MGKKYAFVTISLLIVLSSCTKKVTVKAEDLLGKWKYIRVESPYHNPPDTVTATELDIAKPYILFSKDSVQIWWGGELLSRGSYKLSGDSIRVNEILKDGRTREFPFIVSKITGKQLMFGTTGDDGTLVTAVKQ
ncbi:MAG TPA: hypothetical protein VHC47_12940 [Mucilaginibacter sp.]|nr:hypothetical protein [Mucilaginibacter sp.]